MRHDDARVRRGVHLVRHAGRFAARAGCTSPARKPNVRVGRRRRAWSPARGAGPRGARRAARKARPGDVPLDGDLVEIVHAGAAEGPVGHGKAGGLDDVDGDAQAGGQRSIVPVFCGMSGWNRARRRRWRRACAKRLRLHAADAANAREARLISIPHYRQALPRVRNTRRAATPGRIASACPCAHIGRDSRDRSIETVRDPPVVRRGA